MTDKFPEIEGITETNSEGDFLSREKELLGNEFATEADADIVNETKDGEEEDEFDDFKTQFPEVSGPNGDSNGSEQLAQDEEEEESNNIAGQTSETEKGIVNQFTNLNLNESEHYQEWKKSRELEISKRDEIAQRKLQDTQSQARKEIDDFYENYNNKKDDAIKETKKEADEFAEKNKKFIEDGTLWDRVVQILSLDKNSDTLDSENMRDKSRFRDLLLALKGKDSVPGAAL